MKKFTTMAMGGPAKYFVAVKSERELLKTLGFAERKKLSWCIVGEGSNLIVADKGFRGLVIRNRIEKFNRKGQRVAIGAGNNLFETVRRLNRLGLSGMERMAGIPGTLGGAIYGCAGAYGQEIKDRLVSVRVFDGQRFRTLSKSNCRFGYRDSMFKRKKSWVITEAKFRLGAGERGKLEQMSFEIVKLREKKYPPGLRCPGSFFKNLKLADLSLADREKLKMLVPGDKVMYGKIPTGYLLETAGAKGAGEGKVKVADHHANLIYNPGGGTAGDVKKLAQKLKNLVKKRYGITMEEEVQYLGFS